MYKPPANNIILDTNTWLYLCNGFDLQSNLHCDNGRHFELLSQLKLKQNAGEICILVNDVIIQEWERNKDETKRLIERLQNKIAEVDKRIEADKKYMDAADIILQQQINDRTKASYQIELDKNQRHILDAEHFLKNECKKISISDAVKIQVWDLAINKKAPFHKNKNNVADATILLSAIEYITSDENENVNSFFISNNVEDYCDNKQSSEFHAHIQDLIQVNSLVFERRLDKGLEISEEIQQELDEFYKGAYYESFQFYCKMPNCEGNEHYHPTGYLTDEVVVLQESESRINPNQLVMFDNNEVPKKSHMVRLGDCNTCGSTHIECPVCDELVADVMPGYDFICPHCQIDFYFGYSWHDGTLELIIKDI
jgi:hypothetical protein